MVLYALLWGEVSVEASRVEPFGCAIASFFEVQGMVSISFRTFRCYLHVALLSCAYNLLNLFKYISVLQIIFRALYVLALKRQDWTIPWTCCLLSLYIMTQSPVVWLDRREVTRSIRTVCKYRKHSFLTGLITSLTALLQTNHQGRIHTSKTKSTGSPALPWLLRSFFCFALAEFFSHTRQEPVGRLNRQLYLLHRDYFYEGDNYSNCCRLPEK